MLDTKAKGGLTETSVMDFFMNSPFSDPQSNNALLRMQILHTGMPLDDEPGKLRCDALLRMCTSAEYASDLHLHSVATVNGRYRNLTGIEFAVVHAMPPEVFVIQKRERLSPYDGTSESLDELFRLNLLKPTHNDADVHPP